MHVYLDAESKEVAEIFPVLPENNLSPTASVVDVYYCLQMACGNPQFRICNIIIITSKTFCIVQVLVELLLFASLRQLFFFPTENCSHLMQNVD